MVEAQSCYESVDCRSTMSDGGHAFHAYGAPSLFSYQPDLPPYSTQTSFVVPRGQYDQDILARDALTPNSSEGSTPSHNGPEVMSYPEPPRSPHMQEPTPPGSSRYSQDGWSSASFGMGLQHSQTNSPMPAPTHYTASQMLADRRKEPPSQPSLAPYSGYGASQMNLPPPPAGPYYLQGQFPNLIPTVMHTSQSATNMHAPTREAGRSGVMSPYSDTVECRSPRLDLDNFIKSEPFGDDDDGARLPSCRSLVGAPSRSAKVTKSKKGPTKKPNKSTRAPSEYANCLGRETPPTLKEGCPEEERCIFQARWNQRPKKGQDMWENIQNDHSRYFGRSSGKESLQMKFRRARPRYIQWLPQDEEILRDAWLEDERDRYQRILGIFLRKGGSRNMFLSASDVEVKLVKDLRLEEGVYTNGPSSLPIRRRRKLINRKRTGGERADIAALGTPGGREPSPVPDEDTLLDQISLLEPPTGSPRELVHLGPWDGQVMMKPEPRSPSQ